MGRIFKTPSDNATEETLRAMHIANTVDTTYERTWGWLKTIIASAITALVVSGFEFYIIGSSTSMKFYLPTS